MARYVCLLLSVATLSCGGADRVRVIKLAHGLPISHPVHEAMVFLSERTWEASEGKIRIDVHPAEQLGTERECLELLQIGAVGMTKVSASVLENFVPRYAVFSLPYLFRDEAHRQKVFHGAIGKRILSAGAGLDRFTLLAIPFFILSGQLMNRGGMARRLIDLARGVVGMLPGGLAYVNIVAGMLFGAISGSAVAAVAAVGGFMVPRMREQGYDESFSAAVNVSSATTSLVIPPSNILIVYALAAGGVSIAALFVAGYVPGLLVGLLLMVVAGTIAKRRGYPVDARVGARELARRFFAALPSLFLVVVVMGGIIAGYFTATEAGAVAVLYSFILAVVVYREVATREIPKVLVEASTTTAIVLLLVGTSMAFSWVLAYERIPELIVSAFSLLEGNTVATLLIINVVLLVMGTVLDITPAVLIFTPMLLPVVTALGVDPVHFGIVMVMNLCVGLATPPVGSVLFLGCTVSGASITDVSRALIPLYLAMLVALLLVTFIPDIALALPRWLGI